MQSHSELIFVFSCDSIEGHAILGMAWEMYGEPNAYGVPTMKKYCSAKEFFQDGVDWNRDKIDKAIDAIPLDGRPIIVPPRIGCGCSRMFELAPNLYMYMLERLRRIAYPNVEIDYSQQ